MTHPAIKDLVSLPHAARFQVTLRERNSASVTKVKTINAFAIAAGDRSGEARVQVFLENATDFAVNNKFVIIEIGRCFVPVAAECEKLSRGDWMRAFCVNVSEWFTPAMLTDGDRLHEVVAGRRLANSGTPGAGTLSTQLACCFQVALYNALKTNQVLAKDAHEHLNEMLFDWFGCWQQPNVMQRLGVSS